MDGIGRLVRRHPVGAFFVWFFTVGQALAFTPVVARDVYGTALPVQPFVVASTLVGLLLPALVITRVVDGPDGLRDLWRRTARVRVPLRWYAVAVVLVPALTLALTLALFGVPAGASAATVATAVAYGFVVQGLLVLVTNNLWEEVAWMGFVQARLQQRHGALRAAVMTGPLFALQHVALLVGNELVLAAVVMAVFALVAIGFRALLAWTYNATGSLFLVGVVHAAGNAMSGGSGFAPGLLPRLYANDFVGTMHLLASALIGLTVIAATRGRLALPGDDGRPLTAVVR